MKKIFVYHNKILHTDVLVVVGFGLKEIENWSKKNSSKMVDILKDEENRKLFEYRESDSGGVIMMKHSDGLNYYILRLKDWTGKAENLYTLIHEIIHFKQFRFEDGRIEKENEFEAYFVEDVFKDVFLTLNGFLKK